ncbi:signal peptidase II [Floccifex sp.]|uniref:signal peptidase II n=1 Tax=Floccifex sp. TaxID=2815810 RepID=UPI003F036B24
MKKWSIGILLSMVLIAVDQYTKQVIVNHLALHEQIQIIDHFLYLTYYQNTGAAFSMMEGFGTIFFLIITLVALVVIVYMFYHSDRRFTNFGYILVFSGAIGNLMDRMLLQYVRDFIGVYIGNYAFPIFNVADICITVGFGIILLCMVLEEIEEKKRWKKQLSQSNM